MVRRGHAVAQNADQITVEAAIQLDGYTFDRCIRSNERSVVLAGWRDADGLAVMAKRYIRRPEWARREMEILQRLDSPLVLDLIALEHSNLGPVLVTKLFEGRPITQGLADGAFRADVFVRVARQIAEALAAVHEARIIHGDVSPGNVLVAPQSHQVCLIDFGLAVRFGTSSRGGEGSSVDGEGTLLYISPEQTGRMDRGVDFRSDLYSLGATLYHAATGRPPFECDDPLTLVHAHFAKTPTPPSAHESAIPRTLERIVLKLLEKEPDLRYQSARALATDLAQCEDELARSGTLRDDLHLGAADVPDRPVFRPKLYALADPMQTLRTAFGEAARGQFRFSVVHGPAGTGKTALVEELRKAVSEARGMIALGRFESSATQRQGLGWITALSGLAQQLLVKDEQTFERQRARIASKLQSLASVVTDWVPELVYVLGEQPAPPPVDPSQALHRLCEAVARLLAGCASAETPLALVLDDVQWMDPISAELLRFVVREVEVGGLHLIVTCRSGDGGLDAVPGVAELTPRVGACAQVLETRALARPDLEAMLCDALLTTPDAAQGLVSQIATKTAGIPLLVRQFVEGLADRGLLRYRHPTGWVWDERAVAAADVADDAVDFMARRIASLDAELARVLACASVIGREFQVGVLARLADAPESDIEAALLALTRTGLVCVCDAGLRFSHDQIRAAAHDAIPATERARLHGELGALLRAALPDDDRTPRLLEVVAHLNQGPPPSATERPERIDLDLRAGRVSLARGAAESAIDYVDHARRLLPVDQFADDLARALELCLLGCEATLFSGEFEGALAWLDPLDAFTWDRLTLARIAALRIRVLAVARSPGETVELALEMLRRFGVRWPLHPSRLRVFLAQARTEWWLRGRDSERLFRPPGPNPAIPVLMLTGPAGAAMTRVDAGIATLASCLALSSYARHGVVTRPAFGLSAYANFLLLYWPWPEHAARYRELIFDWDARMPDPTYSLRARVSTLVGVDLWLTWRRKAVDPLADLVTEARESGDMEHAAYALFLRACLRGYVGDPVESVRDDLLAASSALRAGHVYSEPIACLSPYELLLDDEGTIEDRAEASDRFLEEHPEVSEPYVCTMWMMVACIVGRPDIAFERSERVRDDLLRVAPYIHVPDHVFYRGLSAAMLADGARGRERRRLRKALARSRRFLARRGRIGPDFAHMATFLDAERAQLAGKLDRARTLYKAAAEQARRAHYAHHVALVLERSAALERRLRRFGQASEFVERARAEYAAWGATRKVAELAAE